MGRDSTDSDRDRIIMNFKGLLMIISIDLSSVVHIVYNVM